MTPERFRECQAIVGLSDSQLAKILDADDRLIRRWKAGERPIPEAVAEWIEGLAHYWLAHAPPQVRGTPRYPGPMAPTGRPNPPPHHTKQEEHK